MWLIIPCAIDSDFNQTFSNVDQAISREPIQLNLIESDRLEAKNAKIHPR